jgi:diaminopimelate epimerase
MIAFYKYQGTGNDFVMVQDFDKKFPSHDQKFIEFLCHRRFGIGADGLILLQRNDDNIFYMQYFNSDGRESSMCGNGGRCFAQFIFDLGLSHNQVQFMAIDGLHQASLNSDEEGKSLIALQMIPVVSVQKVGSEQFELNTGSPHFVEFMESSLVDFSLIEKARGIRYNDNYKEAGINVNYVNLLGLKEVQIRTYERGVEDETLSCGTGATAAALSTAIFNHLPAGKHQIQVKVMGGQLAVKFHFEPTSQSFSDIWLVGPAEKVYEGQIHL